MQRALIIAGGIIVVVAAGVWLYASQQQQVVTSFEECVAAGNPVMESYPRQCRSADGELFVEAVEDVRGVEGRVVAIDESGAMVDRPYLVTIETDAGERTIAIPSMGIRLCAAADAIASTADFAVGDTIAVYGDVESDGSIVPCASSEHFVRVTAHGEASLKVAPADIEDGSYVAYLVGFDANPEDAVLTFDPVLYYTGDEARMTAQDMIDCGGEIETCAPTLLEGYFVVNSETQEFSAPLSAEATINGAVRSDSGVAVLSDASEQPHPKAVFDIVVENGVVISVDEKGV